ncbi:ankyrin repeat and protein kinase domain-containing protein 1-like [Microplitis demolitor]|uniref:ankyrin repeat and protein kinase domain-containing protein 1-like n=1 Tax=Microplitis demolitor TaxID=69319 RepID=UPI0004CCCE53|nr:ankyrin repeat and protein kinase domain-containing protein 1-like [Microplitis demolitor]
MNITKQARLLQDLIRSVRHLDKDLVNGTTKNFDINGIYGFYGTPLHMAARIGNYEIFKNLIKIGADIHKRIPETQTTVLHTPWLLKMAISSSLTAVGDTALHIAASIGTKEVTTLLLDNNANVNVNNMQGWTPIMRAVGAKNYEAMDTLIEYSPDLFNT